jgi:hypothetical protein
MNREAMIPCILLALGGNLIDGKFISQCPHFISSLSNVSESFNRIILMNHGLLLVLVAGPGSSKLGFKTTAAIVFARLLLVPPVGLGIVMLADKLGFLPPDDKMFRFVLLLQHSMPTSVLSGI